MIDYSLYVITTEVKEKGRSHLDVAKAALEGGATVIQFREKNFSSLELFRTALSLRDLTADFGKPLIINDRLDIALAVEADGVHLGWEDLPFEAAQKFKDRLKIIGLSVRNLEEARFLSNVPASYFGAGPVFSTPSKPDATPPIGVENLKKIVEVSKAPVVAIGGINLDNLDEVLKTGVRGVAVISAIAYAEDMAEMTRGFKQKFKFFEEAKSELVKGD